MREPPLPGSREHLLGDARDAPPLAGEGRSASSELVHQRVLVADGEPQWRRFLESTLEACGHEVVSAGDGDGAWSILDQEDSPRLAVIDWNMPGVDGLELCRRVRGRVYAPYTYLLMLTSNIPPPDLVEGVAAGIDDYLTKPFRGLELEFRLRLGHQALLLRQQVDEVQRQLANQTTHDPVTGIWSRSAALDLVAAERARSRRDRRSLGLVILDLDGFSEINDEYGREIGDAVLRSTAGTLGACLRPYGVLARYGADQFLVALPSIDAASLVRVVERLRRQVSAAPVRLSRDLELPVTCSCGAVSAAWDWTAGQEILLRMADDAVARAKHIGRDQTVLVLAGTRNPQPTSP